MYLSGGAPSLFSCRVTVPHPERDIPVGTLKSIEKQSGLKLR
ncbi:MAG: type II toxin-antitoxin system HicA family toxin [Bradyrhizobium sp.]